MNPRNAQSEILNGPIIATMIPLAAPNLVTVLVQSGVTISETWFIGILGTAPLAAVALVFPFMIGSKERFSIEDRHAAKQGQINEDTGWKLYVWGHRVQVDR